MTEELAVYEPNTTAIEAVIAKGDLAKLSPGERVNYYMATCRSLKLNPMTKPFDYINLSGKLTLYATRTAADQLRKENGVSIEPPDISYVDDLIVVKVSAVDKTGRRDTDLGAVFLGNLKGADKANAIMKAITKAKRRVTLSICGLGWADESEIETIHNAQVVDVDVETGEIKQPHPAPATPAPAPTNGGNGHSREKLVNRLHELAQESAALGQTVELDLTWLAEAPDSELVAYGKQLKANMDALKAAPQQRMI